VIERLEIREAEPVDAPDVAETHLAARREVMPYLHRPHTDNETRDNFGRSSPIAGRPGGWLG
jgi:hypothetical protein